MWSIHHSSMVALMVKNLPANAGDTRDTDSILILGRYPREGNGNPLQHSCLENSTDRGAWWATVHGIVKSQMQLNRSTRAQGSYNVRCKANEPFVAVVAKEP